MAKDVKKEFLGFRYERVGYVTALSYKGKTVFERVGGAWEIRVSRLTITWVAK